jgi:hypothetical protein
MDYIYVITFKIAESGVKHNKSNQINQSFKIANRQYYRKLHYNILSI